MRLTETALEIVARDQPNCSWSGSMITLGAARNEPAPSSATKAIAATHHARWIRLMHAGPGLGRGPSSGGAHAADRPLTPPS